MADPFRKVRTGEPLRIPATAYNAFIDAAHLARRIDPNAFRDAALPSVHEHLVFVRNDSAEDLPRFGILGIAGPIILPGEDGNPDEFKRRTALIGMAITATDEYIGRFVVAREPIVAGRIGLAVIRGVTPAIVNVILEEHTHADTYPDEQHLRSGFMGAARILWKEEGVGPKLAVIEIGPADRDRFPAKLGLAHLIDGRTFGWLYEWDEVRLDADPISLTFGQYIQPMGGFTSAGENAALKLAFNRYEAHLSVMYPQPNEGTEGFANAGACIVPGVFENCPPPKAAVPMLQPIPKGVVVEMRAERTLLGDTRFVFDAMTPVVFCEMHVPEGWYA